VVQSRRDQDGGGNSIILDQPHEILSPKSVTSQRKDVIKGIQPKFMYQSTFPDYYEPMEHWEMDENTNVDVFEETKENYPRS